MKKSSISNLFLALVGSIYLFVSIIVGILTEGTSAYWEGFGFFTFGAVVAILLLLIYGNQETTIRDVFFNSPIYYIGMVYFVIVGIISIIHMIKGAFTLKMLLVVQLIVFAVFVAYFILALVNKRNAQNVIQKVADKNAFLREMSSKMNGIIAICDNADIKKELESLADEFKYGKPAYGEALSEIEELIRQKVAALEFQISESDAEVSQTIADLKKYAIQRGQIASNVR